MPLPVDAVMRALIIGSIVLGSLVTLLILVGAFIQFQRDRQNAHRIERFKAWEAALPAYLFREPGTSLEFMPIPKRDLSIFQTFLARYQATLGGAEAEYMKDLYLSLGIHKSLTKRLWHRSATIRAQAAQEVGVFKLTQFLEQLTPLLVDPVPYVSHMAALALARSGDLKYARPVLLWVMQEELYQRERLLRVLEGFGPDLLPWLESCLDVPSNDPEAWILYALLAASHKDPRSERRLLQLLDTPNVDVQAAALKALAVLADPLAYPRVLPFAHHAAWPVRALAAKALGLIGGPEAIPDLIDLTCDQIYEVRRNAAQGLADLGHSGYQALARLAEDPTADRFARDIARERLEWAEERGHQ